VALAQDYYEIATAFPTGPGVDGAYDWIGLWTYKALAAADGTKAVYGDFVPVLRARFDRRLS
jgi:hypothetical protein